MVAAEAKNPRVCSTCLKEAETSAQFATQFTPLFFLWDMALEEFTQSH